MNPLQKAIFDALNGNVAGITGVFYGEAPRDQAYPFIVFNEQSNVDEYTYTQRAWLDTVYQIKVISRGDSAKTANDAAAAMDLLLTDVELTLSTGTLMYLRRQSGIHYPEMTQGERFNHAGGLYRIWVS